VALVLIRIGGGGVGSVNGRVIVTTAWWVRWAWVITGYAPLCWQSQCDPPRQAPWVRSRHGGQITG
jgi:hypothetical protein